MNNRGYKNRVILFMFLFLFFVTSCGTQRKVSRIEKEGISPNLSLADENTYLPTITNQSATRDTLKFTDDDGSEILIMRAIKDEEGDMVAHEVLDAAVVTTRFRNIAERHGKVDLCFNVTIPASLQDSKWQLRFYPDMYVLGDSIRLEPVVITGYDYRRSQLRGYQHYEKFLSTIEKDTTKFINIRDLDLFIKRNIPNLYAFKTDTSYVSNEEFQSCFGVTETEALIHYTNRAAKNRNDRRIARMDKMYRKYVKSPIVSEGIRLDTVMRGETGDFIYSYIQTINTRPRLKKVDIVLSGEIFESDKKLYTIPHSEPLSFYISSLSSFALETERYLTKVVERRAEANTTCYVAFSSGKYDVDLSLGRNEFEINRIKTNIKELVNNEIFDLDSIIVTSFASPEGKASSNDRLSRQRSESITKFLNGFIKEYQDSVRRDASAFSVDEEGKVVHNQSQSIQIPFLSRSNGENWAMLDMLVDADTTLTDLQKSKYNDLKGVKDLDLREKFLSLEKYYPYIRSEMYPKLRTVKFNFYLHRKGMIKDTVHTTVLDSTYMSGVKALKDMDYPLALQYLRPYNDYNTAVAYMGNDKNASALVILEKLDRTPDVLYLLAILYSRMGNIENAVQCYLKACKANHSFVYRGNLDPEISVLIKEYGLNQEEDEFDY